MTRPSEPCRFAGDTGHECVAYDGGTVRDGSVCWYEARSQVLDQREAQGLPREPTAAQFQRVAEIIKASRQRAAS